MAESDLTVQLAALLFVATEPLSATRLATVTAETEEEVAAALDQLRANWSTGGINLSVVGGQYRLVSAPAAAVVVRRFLQDERSSDLSRAALETLAIIAYRGPLTRSAIEAIRGVASETILRNLLGRGLITAAGRSTEPGRPALYTVSHGFLQHFGLTSTADLPPLPESERDTAGASNDTADDHTNPGAATDTSATQNADERPGVEN